jgi:hypothetical protein
VPDWENELRNQKIHSLIDLTKLHLARENKPDENLGSYDFDRQNWVGGKMWAHRAEEKKSKKYFL